MGIDVAIVGGGPSGCAAALTLRSLGLSVCVIAAPGQKDRPTETAVPALPGLLRSLGASEALSACEPCYGIVSAWGSTTPAFQPGITNPYGHPWFIHRRRFDTCLREAACSHGAEWLAEQVQRLDHDPDGVSISTSGKLLRAHWAVIATGSPVSAARLTSQKVHQFDSMIAFWAHFPTSYEERLLHVEPADFGWWYLCPADGPGAFACFVTDPATARKLRPNKPESWNALFRQTDLYRALPSEALASEVYVALTGLAALPQTCGTHWIAVGDAAAKLDPLGSSGLATALDSGRRAAKAIADALQGNTAALDRYGRWSTGLVEEFARQRRQQYALEAPRHRAGFWPRRLPVAA